jgi:hypothetical protein
LFAEDLHEIEEILTRDGQEFRLLTDKYEYNDVAAMINSEPTIVPKLEMKVRNPYISVNISSDTLSMYVADHDDKSHRLAKEIDDILATKKRRFGFLYNMWAWLFFIPGLGGLLIGSSLSSIVNNHHFIDWRAQLVLSLMLATYSTFYLTMGRDKNKIVLESRGARSFLKRNRDQLLIALIAALLGALATKAFEGFPKFWLTSTNAERSGENIPSEQKINDNFVK